jgi:hypothetical protein
MSGPGNSEEVSRELDRAAEARDPTPSDEMPRWAEVCLTLAATAVACGAWFLTVDPVTSLVWSTDLSRPLASRIYDWLGPIWWLALCGGTVYPVYRMGLRPRVVAGTFLIAAGLFWGILFLLLAAAAWFLEALLGEMGRAFGIG